MKRFLLGAIAGAAGVVLLALLVGQIPTSGLEAVDDRIIVHRMPLWEKAAKFYIRHREFRQWAEEAAGGETYPQRRVLRLMEWTRNVVKPIPSGLPLIDDHISHIVLRHYGNDGQLAEVFTALATYTGNEGRWHWANPLERVKESFCLSFVISERGRMVFDVTNGGWYETLAGNITTIEDFRHPEQLYRRGQAPETLNGTPSLTIF